MHTSSKKARRGQDIESRTRTRLVVVTIATAGFCIAYSTGWFVPPAPVTGSTLRISTAAFPHVPSQHFASAATAVATGYTFWSSDFHVAPIADLKEIFNPMGMTVIDKSLSRHCTRTSTCAKDLKVLTAKNGIDLGNCPNQLKRDFFDAYKSDPEMLRVDAFLCNHACGLCEVFMPFNKSLIVIASTRYEIGRHLPKRWMAWNENLRKIAANPRNIVAANNVYDQEYIKYFTGIKNVHLLPNYCGYTKATYSPTKAEVIVGPGRGVKDSLFKELRDCGRDANVTFARVRDVYKNYEYSDIAQHPAIVLIPYQVSIMSIFEYYNMAIPMFAPSQDLLTQWQLNFRVMPERTWEGAFKRASNKSLISAHPSVNIPHDPNNDNDEAALKYWLKLSDFYVWPHIQTYDSWSDLVDKLKAADLKATSKAMQAHNEKTLARLQQQWQGHFDRIFDGLPPAAQQPRVQEKDFEKALLAQYGVSLSGCYEQTVTH